MFPNISSFRSLKDLHEEIFEEITLQLKILDPSIGLSFCTFYWNLKLIHVINSCECEEPNPKLYMCEITSFSLPQNDTKTQIK